MVKKRLMLFMVFVLLVTSTGFVFGNKIEESKDWTRDNIQANVEFGIDFPYDIDKDNIKTSSSSVQYLRYENGTHYFISSEDLESVSGTLYYSKESGTNETEEESGDGNNNGAPGGGIGTEIDWGSFALGKHGWDRGDSVQFAIRVDISKYQDHDYIILKDIGTNLSLQEGTLIVSLLQPDSEGVVVNKGIVEYVLLENNGDSFSMKIPIYKIDDGSKGRYDIVYYSNKIDKNQGYTNKYQIFTEKEWGVENSGGDITGACPLPDHSGCEDIIEDLGNQIQDEKDTIIELEEEKKELEDKIKELESENEKLKEENEDLKNKEPVIKEVEVIKEVKVPYYITEVRFSERIKEVIKEIEKPCIYPPVVDTPKDPEFIDPGTPIIPIYPEPEPSVPEDIVEKNEEKEIDKEIDDTESIEEDEIVEEDETLVSEGTPNVIKEKDSIKQEENNVVEDMNKEGLPEKNQTLPKTGAKSKPVIVAIGLVWLCVGILMLKNN